MSYSAKKSHFDIFKAVFSRQIPDKAPTNDLKRWYKYPTNEKLLVTLQYDRI